jgi:hypothetical protein
LLPDCSPLWAQLVDEALTNTVERRIASAGEFKRRLGRIRDPSMSTSARQPAAPSVAVPFTLTVNIDNRVSQPAPYHKTVLLKRERRCPRFIPADATGVSLVVRSTNHRPTFSHRVLLFALSSIDKNALEMPGIS